MEEANSKGSAVWRHFFFIFCISHLSIDCSPSDITLKKHHIYRKERYHDPKNGIKNNLGAATHCRFEQLIKQPYFSGLLSKNTPTRIAVCLIQDGFKCPSSIIIKALYFLKSRTCILLFFIAFPVCFFISVPLREHCWVEGHSCYSA